MATPKEQEDARREPVNMGEGPSAADGIPEDWQEGAAGAPRPTSEPTGESASAPSRQPEKRRGPPEQQGDGQP